MTPTGPSSAYMICRRGSRTRSGRGHGCRGRRGGPPLRLLGHLDLGDEAARRRVPAGELDARRLADQAAPAVAPDEILRPQRSRRRPAGRRRRCRPASKPVTSRAVEDGHAELGDPAGQDALDVLLPQREPVVVAGREVADVQAGAGEPRDLRDCPAERNRSATPRWSRTSIVREAGRPRGSRRGPGWAAARRSRRRRPPAPARPRASAPSALRRRSARRGRSSAPSICTSPATRPGRLASAGDSTAAPGSCGKPHPARYPWRGESGRPLADPDYTPATTL